MLKWSSAKTYIPFLKVTWLVVSTYLQKISQNGNLPQIGVNMKNIWNHLVTQRVSSKSILVF